MTYGLREYSECHQCVTVLTIIKFLARTPNQASEIPQLGHIEKLHGMSGLRRYKRTYMDGSRCTGAPWLRLGRLSYGRTSEVKELVNRHSVQQE